MAGRTWARVLLAAILVAALLLRILPLTYSHFWDEAVFLQNAKVMLGARSNYDEFFLRPPALSALYAMGFALWDDIFVANIVQGIVTTLAVLLTFAYARRAFDATTALCAAFLLAFTPYFVETSHELLTDMPAVASMLAAMWLFDKPGARFALLAGVAYALAVQTRFTSLFLIVYFVLDARVSPRKLRRLALLLLGAAVTIVPYLAWVRWNYGSFFYPFVLARRIVTEWTAPVPARFYFDALLEIFPPSLWLALGLGVLALVARTFRRGERTDPTAMPAALDDAAKRQIVLLLWGVLFLAYMLTIPHKEVRYLLPLAIPVALVGGAGAAALFSWLSRQAFLPRIVGLLLGAFIAITDDTASFEKLADPWVDRSESEDVQIARYLREVSKPDDTIYAAHNFPVLAFYSGHSTVSLLPIQEDFEQDWPSLMTQPGFLVYFPPSAIKETHALHLLKPDAAFLDAHPGFSPVRVFPSATVYRYDPAR